MRVCFIKLCLTMTFLFSYIKLHKIHLQQKEHSPNRNWMKFVYNCHLMNGSIHINRCWVLASMMLMLLWVHYSWEDMKLFGLINASKLYCEGGEKRPNDNGQDLIKLIFLLCFRDPFCIDTSNILGFIMNVPSEYKFGFIVLPFRREYFFFFAF